MAFQCEPQHTFGYDYCLTRCPSIATGVFEQLRVEREADRPAADPRVLDVAVLDMNHGWPNVGHDAIVMAIQTIACDVREALLAARLRVRAISYDVRRGGVIPRKSEQGGIYVGTGGPGHLDPRQNDGLQDGSQGIRENPAWEAPLFALFDAIHDDRQAALLGVCHTFGVMCRWLGVARPVLRGPEKGGKSAGIVDNVLTPTASAHAWFRHLVDEAHGDRISILDNRLYDLIPTGDWRDVQALSFEASLSGESGGESLTMMEVDREAEATMPRILAVNHHPEVVNRARILTLLWQKRARGEVSHTWYEERAAAMTQTLRDESSDRGLDLTSRYTFFEPLRFHIYQQLRRRAATLGEHIDVDEAAVLEWARITR